ncbi:MAG: hypothetical protein JO187_09310 [Acidobacteria bacterium]|nr:hypothetical protein [Acidobacteriota bacterium]
MKLTFAVILVMSISAIAQENSVPDLDQLNKMAARFAATPITVNTSALSAGDQKALAKLIAASRLLNTLFLNQRWSGNLALYQKLQQDQTPLGRARLHYFWLMKAPWSSLDEEKAFLPGVPPKQLQTANFYPEDMTKEEFESWLKTLPPDQQQAATGFFTIVRRDAQRKLTLVPYSEAYREQLAPAAKLLQEAAALTSNPSLKKFLNSRADAFRSNDYRPSDEDWMALDAPLDITIGPYETYNDELFGYKAAYESYVNIRDDQESAKLSFLSQHLQELENNLPEDPQYRRPKLGNEAPIRVVNEVFASGDGDHSVKTAAYNLPNDEVVVHKLGSKRVMLKNIEDAKFQTTLLPLSKIVLATSDQDDIDANAFFSQIVTHELMHGLGPQQITIQGRPTTARLELKDLYSAIEEAKADVTSLWALRYMLEQPNIRNSPALRGLEEKKLYTTYLVSCFRTLRFSAADAHGKGMAVQMNWLLEKGGYVARPDGTFAVDYTKVKEAFRSLDHELLTLEATGDYAGAQKLFEQYGPIRPEVQKALDKAASLPVDVDVQFVTADKISPQRTSGGTH